MSICAVFICILHFQRIIQSSIYGTMNGDARCAGLTFFYNDDDTVSDYQIGCNNETADIRPSNGNMSVVNILIDIVADIDSSKTPGANSRNDIIIDTIVDTILYSAWPGINRETVVHFHTILLTSFENCLLDCNVRNEHYLGCNIVTRECTVAGANTESRKSVADCETIK